ncbi:MAG TPA: V-type ATPase 116kDa subunit family protein [Anaerolineales bacterium]|nr:V-type ATPase 116kDa subunit family protein [Anaerolineales bacterium]
MFFPEKMAETQLIVPEKDLLPVTKVLAAQGIFHQVDASYLSSDNTQGPVDSWKERAVAYTALERQILFCMQALSVDEGKPIAADQNMLTDVENVRPMVEQIELAVKSVNDGLAAAQKTLAALQSDIHQLEPVASFDLDIGLLRNPLYIHSILGSMPTINLERLETSLARIPHAFLTLRKEKESAVVWLTGAHSDAGILERAARSAYLNPLDLGTAHNGTPADIIKALQAEIEKAGKDIEGQQAKIKELHRVYDQQLQTLLWQVRVSRMLADAMARFGKLQYTYLIVGWVPSSKLGLLSQRLQQASKNIVIESTPSSQRGEMSHSVPVALRNPGLLGAFQALVTTYSRPRYEEIDPTVLMTITFPLLFGAMFGDVGHGLLLLALGWLLASKKVKALKSMSGLGSIILACGAVAMVFGLLYGSLFGSEEFFRGLFGFGALWIEPLKSIDQILGVAIGAGVIILSLGYLLNIYNAWRARDWGRLIFDHHGLAGLLFYWSLLGIGASVLLPSFPVPTSIFVGLVILAALAVMFSEALKHLVTRQRPLIKDGLFTYLVQAVVELFENLISSLSNSVSYVRVGAFAVAHGGLSAVIFILANLLGGTHGVIGAIVYWTVVALGNLFIVGFEGLIVGIQTMRLEYYEFFSKFFEGGGMSYEPLVALTAGEK